jgi:hypothetical protein
MQSAYSFPSTLAEEDRVVKGGGDEHVGSFTSG